MRITLRTWCWRMVLAVAALLASYSGAGVSGSHSQGERRPARVELYDWRRTTTGWEQASDWQPNSPALLAMTASQSASAIHPLVVAALELLVSLGALLHFSPAASIRGIKVAVKSPDVEIA